jgi:hypothetical protein
MTGVPTCLAGGPHDFRYADKVRNKSNSGWVFVYLCSVCGQQMEQPVRNSS